MVPITFVLSDTFTAKFIAYLTLENKKNSFARKQSSGLNFVQGK